MANAPQPADVWMQLEQEGYHRQVKKKGKLPSAKFRKFYSQTLTNGQRNALDPLLLQFVQIQAARQERADNPLQTPQDLSNGPTEEYLGAIQRRQDRLQSDIQCITNIEAMGNGQFNYGETMQALVERRQELEVENEELHVRLNAFLERHDEHEKAGRGSVKANKRMHTPGQARQGAIPSQADNAVRPMGAPGAAAALQEANAIGKRLAQDPLMAALEEEGEGLARGIAAKAKNKQKERHQQGQLKDSWWAARDLGSGTWGKAVLYVKQNHSGLIVDRLAVKDSKAPSDNEFNFDRSGNDPKVPDEVAAMMLLRPLKGSESIVRIRNWRGSRKEEMYRIYMEYCPFGDMWKIMSAHKQHGTHVPEPFVWFFFETLAKAGLLMDRGDLEQHRGDDFWKLILHRDIKLPNIFLGLNSSDSFKGYNMPKLGDFGLCLISDGGDVATSRSWFTGYAYHAPEVRADRLQGDEHTETTMSAKTNLWEIALSIYALMRRDGGIAALNGPGLPDHYDLDRQFYTTRRMPAPFNAREVQFYSQDLRELVMHCLEYLPKDRPSLDAVLKRIRRHTGSGSRDLARGLRHAPADGPGFTKFALLLGREQWPLRSMLRDEPANLRDRQVPRPPKRKQKRDEDNETDSSDDSLGGDPSMRMLFDPASRTPTGPKELPQDPLGELGMPRGHRPLHGASPTSPTAAGANVGGAGLEKPRVRNTSKRGQTVVVDLTSDAASSPKRARTEP